MSVPPPLPAESSAHPCALDGPHSQLGNNFAHQNLGEAVALPHIHSGGQCLEAAVAKTSIHSRGSHSPTTERGHTQPT